MGKRKIVLLIVGLVLVIGVGYQVYAWFIHTEADYLTVSEAKSQMKSLNDQMARVGGRVVPGSIDWDDRAKIMWFSLSDDKENLKIIYQGIVPDNFKPGAEIIIEGKYGTEDTFEVSSFVSRRSLCTLCH